MTNLGVVFLTGLTTGGLSCLAVQSGLLASSIAHQAEQDLQKGLAATKSIAKQTVNNPAVKTGRKKKRGKHSARQPRDTYPSAVAMVEPPKKRSIQPIVFFLGSKLVAYTLLGFLLGWLGSVLQLNPYTRSVLQLGIGIFMIGTALRMLHVHPIFRYFAVEPPTMLTRYIRRKAKDRGSTIVTPSFLGALTVLIPCGVTQAIMALAIGAGTPLAGAAIMFAFTLGTSPVFFTLAYLATRLGERLQARFLKVAAATVLILGLLTVDSTLNLMGSSLSVANMIASITPVNSAQSQQQIGLHNKTTDSGQVASGNVVTINALDYGYAPTMVRAKAGQPTKLNVVTNETYGCTRAFVIPALGIQEILPASGKTVFELPAQQAGTVRFTCSMGMYGGHIQFE